VNDRPPPAPSKYLVRDMDPAGREFYRRLAEEASVATTRCAHCRRTDFPPRLRCPTCGEPLEWVKLPLRGRLYAFTTQETAARFRAPAVLALAELGEAVLPGIVDAPYESLAIGQEVRVELRREPETGLTLLAFEPV
jgi:uncharacterized OB-fold protein